MKFKKLDKIDTLILNYLSADGRMNYAELGRKLNLTRAAIRERINSLVEKGIIDRFTIIVNSRIAGKSISVFFNIEAQWELLPSVVAQLTEHDEITNIYQMSGKPHLHVHALIDDQEHLEDYMNKLHQIEGITNITSEVLLKRYKDARNFRI